MVSVLGWFEQGLRPDRGQRRHHEEGTRVHLSGRGCVESRITRVKLGWVMTFEFLDEGPQSPPGKKKRARANPFYNITGVAYRMTGVYEE